MPDFATLGRQITLIFRRHWNTASVLAMYLFSLFVQIRNCVMLAEGRRLGMERDELLQLLVCGE